MSQNQKVFTQIKLLVAIGIIAVLAAVVIIIINPGRQFIAARNIARESHASSIEKALLSHQIANQGTMHSEIEYGLKEICNTGIKTCEEVGAGGCDGYANLCFLVPDYISSMPIDPKVSLNGSPGIAYAVSLGGTGYYVAKNRDNRVGIVQGKKEIPCPNNWTGVPGNPLYGTKDFCVMKYEAKYDCTGDRVGDSADTCAASASFGLGLDWRDVDQNPNKVVSTANGAPIVHIAHNQAINACPSDSSLITNAQWMTIARNVETIASNWANGVVGSIVEEGGGLFRGNVEILDSASYSGDAAEFGEGRDTKAELVLSNGQTIWDLSGNVWEHVRRDEEDTLTDNLPRDGGVAGWRWIEHTDIVDYGELSYDIIRSSDATYNAAYGVGCLYTNSVDSTDRVFVRGGRWGHGAFAGVFALHLYRTVSGQYNSVGFRCVRVIP